jgi:hypothetical protein
MDLLGHLGQTGDNAQTPDPARDRGSQGRQTPSLLLAWLSASQGVKQIDSLRPLRRWIEK